jgi:hypothetical protein
MRYYKSTNSFDPLVKRQDVQILKHLPKNLGTKLFVENEGWLNVETGGLLTVLNQGYMIHARLTHSAYPLSCPFHHTDTRQVVALGTASRKDLHRVLQRRRSELSLE